MERRTEMAWRQRLQLSRRERARRERPWLVVASSVLAFSMLQRLLELWREAKREALQQWHLPQERALGSFRSSFWWQ